MGFFTDHGGMAKRSRLRFPPRESGYAIVYTQSVGISITLLAFDPLILILTLVQPKLR